MSKPSFVSTVDPWLKPGSLFAAENRLHLSLVLTLLLLLLYGHSSWYVNLPLSILAIAALVFPILSSVPATWAVATMIIFLGSLGGWYAIDNHKYLLGYWTLALTWCLGGGDPLRDLARSARWLIGLVFALAVLQKTLSGDYLDGRFMYYELLLDQRFAGLARHLGGLPDHVLELNHAAREALVNYASDLASVQLQGRRSLEWLAAILTWWVYAIEAGLAIAFLSRHPRWLHERRDWILLAFLSTTYLFATVIGFGWVLAIMGIAQTEDEDHALRGLYLAAFLLLQAYQVRWSEAWSAIVAFLA